MKAHQGFEGGLTQINFNRASSGNKSGTDHVQNQKIIIQAKRTRPVLSGSLCKPLSGNRAHPSYRFLESRSGRRLRAHGTRLKSVRTPFLF